METKFDYTKHIENSTSGYEKIGHSLNENRNNIRWDKLNEQQKKLAEKIQESPDYFPTFTEFKLLLEMAALTDYMWAQNKKIKVYFFSKDEVWIAKTLEIANTWYKHGNISFVREQDQLKSEVRVAFNNDGCWSYIGNIALRIPKDQPTLNLEISNLTPSDAEFKRLTLHEFGHALGLIHEHQSPSAIMKWRKDYIYQYFLLRYGWNKQKVDVNLFDEYVIYNKRHSELDTKSIMAYYIPKEFTEDQVVFPLNYDLSEKDKEYISHLYPKPLHS